MRIAILASGRGSNAEAIVRACSAGELPGCAVVAVMSNVAEAPVLERARAMGVHAEAIESKGRTREAHEGAMQSLLETLGVDLVCLAGYMRVLSATFVHAWQGRLLNVHPSLLPAFVGMHAQRQALEYGVQVAGCTVHYVEEAVDGGAIILQRAVAVLPEDTEETLAARILAEEHGAYVEGIRRVVSGEYALRGRRYLRRD